MKCAAFRLLALLGRGAGNVDLRRRTFVFLVVLTVTGLTVHMDGLAGSAHGTGGLILCSGLEALTAGFTGSFGFLTAYHDVSLAAVLSFVVNTAHC